MIILHHLGISQSERIVWLLEELQLDYKLVKHVRAPMMAPESLTSIPGNQTGKAPFIEDTTANITMSESAAICEYIVRRYGNDRLTLPPSDPGYPDYVYWFHYANGSFQPSFSLAMIVSLIPDLPEDSMVKHISQARLDAALRLMDGRLQGNRWLAGEEFTIADIMTGYSATTQRYWGPLVSFKEYPNIVRWLKDCSEREGYRRAREKGDPEMKDLIDAEPPKEGSLLVTGGVDAGHWRK